MLCNEQHCTGMAPCNPDTHTTSLSNSCSVLSVGIWGMTTAGQTQPFVVAAELVRSVISR